MKPDGEYDPDSPVLSEQLPEVLAVIEAVLIVHTNDDGLGRTVLQGFEYYARRELLRQQPALALLYDIQFELLSVEAGSRRYRLRAIAKLKSNVRAELRKAGAVANIALLLGIPSAALATADLVQRFFPPAQAAVQCDIPQAPTELEYVEVRRGEARDTFRRDGGGKDHSLKQDEA